jgi:hypothetical protein
MWVMWSLSSFRLETVLLLVQDRYMVCARCTIALEIVLDALDGTTWWRGSGESLFQSFESLTQDRGTVCVECTIGSGIILNTPDGTPRWRSHVKLISFCLEIVLVLVQNRCMVCARRTIGLEIILDESDCTTRWRGLSGSSFLFIWRTCHRL